VWVAANDVIDVTPVQRLIVHSFTVNPGELAGDALAFLSGDRRRLFLGGIENSVGTTARLMERWLFEPPPRVQDEADTSPTMESSKDAETNEKAGEVPTVRSLLWGYGGVSVVPSGRFPLLEALVKIYLRRNDIPKLLDLLKEALEQHVGDQDCWQHLLILLIYLRPAPREVPAIG
jgi:hypothetical protein